MVDRIRNLFRSKDEETGASVGYVESKASKIDIKDMPGPLQKADSWIRQYVPMKDDEDCLYCKLISTSVLTLGTLFVLKSIPRTMREKCTTPIRKVIYGGITAGLAATMVSLTFCNWFDVRVTEQSDMSDFQQVRVQVKEIFTRKSDNNADILKLPESRDR